MVLELPSFPSGLVVLALRSYRKALAGLELQLVLAGLPARLRLGLLAVLENQQVPQTLVLPDPLAVRLGTSSCRSVWWLSCSSPAGILLPSKRRGKVEARIGTSSWCGPLCRSYARTSCSIEPVEGIRTSEKQHAKKVASSGGCRRCHR